MIYGTMMTGTKFRMKWRNMLKRCYCENLRCYKEHGARGITVSEEWKKFENFKADMYMKYLRHCSRFGIKQTTLERINNALGYSKENCKWATYFEQNQNRRDNVLVKYKGETLPSKTICRKYRVPYTTFRKRLGRHWSISKALETPVRKIIK